MYGFKTILVCSFLFYHVFELLCEDLILSCVLETVED